MPEDMRREAMLIIERMPEGASLEDIVYELYVRAEIERGLQDIREGRTLSHEEVMRSVAKWLQSAGQ